MPEKHWTHIESKVIRRVHKSRFTARDVEALLAAESRRAHNVPEGSGRVEVDEDYNAAGDVEYTVTIEVHVPLETEGFPFDDAHVEASDAAQPGE